MPSVQVIDLLYSKVFGKQFKHITHEDEDRSRSEDLDNEGEVAEDDPMAQLFECAPDIELETPKKNKPGEEKYARPAIQIKPYKED